MNSNTFHRGLAFFIVVLFIDSIIIPFTDDFAVSKEIRQGNARDSPPNEEWNRTYTYPGRHTCGYCVQVTPDYGYIVTGYAGYGYWYDVYLLKVDGQGNVEWNRIFGDQDADRYDVGQWVEVTSDKGYIITGQNGFGNLKVWLIKTDANGNEEWNRTYGSNQASGSCVKQTKDGGYVVTGGEANRLLLMRTDAFGNELWSKTYENYSGGYSLGLTSDGGYIVTGSLSPGKLLLMKTDKNGTVEWEKEFFNTNSSHGSWGKGVQQTFDGGYIVGGTNSDASWATELWLIKTDENGVEQWNRTFGNFGFDEWDWGYSVIQTVDGDFVLGGTQLGLQGFIPDKFWLVRTHSDGSVVWDHFYLPSLSARCHCLQETPDGGIIATGVVDIQPDPICVILKISGGNNPPNPLPIEGPHWGVINELYQFYINATDPDGDVLYCIWEWGDGNSTGWLGPYSNGTISASHIWSRKGTYEIRVKLKDVFEHESDWSDPHVFNVGESKLAFLIGRCTNMTTEGDFRIVEAVNLWMILFRPVHSFHYSAGEKIPFLMNKSKAFTTPRFIMGLVDAVI